MAQVVLITGCRSGFGLLAAVECARRGHTVYAGLRDLSTKDDLVAMAEGLPVVPVQLDVTSAEERARVVDEIITAEGRLDALVNNAGIAVGGFQEQLSEAEVRKVMEVNVFAVWALTKLCLPHMRAQGHGAVINIGSMSGRMGMPGIGAYAASKFALEGMTESLRHEVRPFGVRVCVVEPGPYKTDIFGRNRRIAAAAQEHDPADPYGAWTAHLDEVAAKLTDRTAGDPMDVARKIADLVEAPSFALRHPMGGSAKVRLFLKTILPYALFEWAVGRMAGPPD